MVPGSLPSRGVPALGLCLPIPELLSVALLFRAYPLAGFIVEHAAGSNLDIRLRQQAPLRKDQMDMIVPLGLVMVERRDTFHVIPLLELLRKLPQYPLGFKLRIFLRQRNDQLPRLNTFSLSSIAPELLLTLLRKIVPEGHIFPCREGGVQVFLGSEIYDILPLKLDNGGNYIMVVYEDFSGSVEMACEYVAQDDAYEE